MIPDRLLEVHDRLWLPSDPSPEATAGAPALMFAGEDPFANPLCGFPQEWIDEAPPVEVEPDLADPGPPDAVGLATVRRSLPDDLRRAGLRVKTVAGWESRGRPGTFAPRGVMIHHTASSIVGGPHPALGIVTHGRPDLEGPLCNLLIARNATVFVVAAGRANHAGEGGPWRGVPADSGNAYLFGIEVENNGVGEPWPGELRVAMAVAAAVLLRRVGRTQRMVPGHKEWTDRKIDPAGVAMGPFRDRVRRQRRRLAA